MEEGSSASSESISQDRVELFAAAIDDEEEEDEEEEDERAGERGSTFSESRGGTTERELLFRVCRVAGGAG